MADIRNVIYAGLRAGKADTYPQECPHPPSRLRVPTMVRQAWFRGYTATHEKTAASKIVARADLVSHDSTVPPSRNRKPDLI